MTIKNKIILFNAPPRSGKDTAIDFIRQNYPSETRKASFGEELKKAAHRVYNIKKAFDYPNYFEDVKDDVLLDAFMGISPRQAYINVSEMLMKPSHGHDIWGKYVLQNILKDEPVYGELKWNWLVPDNGFIEEVGPLIKTFGVENIVQVRVYSEGYTFENDSRDWVDIPDCKTYEITNERNEKFFVDVDEIYNEIKFT